jgi:hypothetical protein
MLLGKYAVHQGLLIVSSTYLTQRKILMAKNVLGKIGRTALWFSPVIIALAGFVAVAPWLARHSPVANQVLSIALGTFVLGYSLFMGYRMTRGLDEVQKAAASFAHSNGWVWGGFATLLLLMLPPVMNCLIDMVNALAMPRMFVGSPGITNPRVAATVAFFNRRAAITMAFLFGATLVMVIQMLAIIVFSVVWQRRMGGTGERA